MNLKHTECEPEIVVCYQKSPLIVWADEHEKYEHTMNEQKPVAIALLI